MIRIDPDVFTYQPDLDMSNERFAVTGVQDTTVVVAALRQTSARFMLVDETGVEHVTGEALESGELYSPNYVSDPEITSRGIEVYVDCKGAIGDAMADKLREILVEELSAVGYAGTVSAVTHPD